MVAVTLEWFTRAPANMAGGARATEDFRLNWKADTVRAAILNAAPNKDTSEFWSNISASAVAGTNWPAVGVALTGKVIIVDDVANRSALDADDVNVAAVTLSGGTHLAIYKDTGVAGTSILLGFGPFDAVSGSQGGALTIAWNTVGILSFTV